MNEQTGSGAGPKHAPERALQLGYLGLGVTDLPAWDDFAQRILGLQAVGVSPQGWACYRMDERRHRFMLRASDHDAPLFAGWEARDAAAMERIARQAARRGLEVRVGTREESDARGVLEFVAFDDPDGLVTEVYHSPQLLPGSFVSPRGVRFLTGDGGMGHIVLRVADPTATISFYADVLGLRISDLIVRVREGVRHAVTFMHANPRHHSLALVGGLTPDMRQAGKRISHLMVEYETIDDVGAALDEVHARGLRSNLIGRHTNDKMISFYVETPSGFNIEIGAGAVTIAPETWVVSHYDRPSIWGHGEIKRRTIAAAHDD